MMAALHSGALTLQQLMDIPKKTLPARFGGAETTCFNVRKALLGSLTNSDK
jgi:hypothetical protein